MATYKKQFKDKNGNTIYPDVGIDLGNVVYSDDPTTPIGDIIDPYTYSTTETRIGTWIDGKPIYRKTVDCGKGPNAGRKDVAAGISNPDLIVNLYGFSVDLGTCTPVNNARPDNTAAANGAYFENGNIVIKTGVDRTPATFYITVEYTKTTD